MRQTNGGMKKEGRRGGGEAGRGFEGFARPAPTVCLANLNLACITRNLPKCPFSCPSRRCKNCTTWCSHRTGGCVRIPHTQHLPRRPPPPSQGPLDKLSHYHQMSHDASRWRRCRCPPGSHPCQPSQGLCRQPTKVQFHSHSRFQPSTLPLDSASQTPPFLRRGL